LIKTGDNTAIDGTPKVLSDGNGNNLPMEVSTTGVNLTGSPTVNAVAIANATQVAAKQDTLVSGTNIKTINGTSLLGSGNISVVTSPSGVSGAIQFSNGSAFASDASNLFWDDTNKSLGIGGLGVPAQINLKRSSDGGRIGYIKGEGNGVLISTDSSLHQLIVSNRGIGIGIGAVLATARLQVKGSGTTTATTSLLVQNSAGVASLQVLDDTSVFNNGKGAVATNTAFGNGALINNTTGSNNTANGVQALENNQTGNSNTANGLAALRFNTASNNTAVGFEAAFTNTSGTGITAIGYQALRASTGANNTALGFQAGDNITTGAGNVCIGSGAEPLAATDSNQFVVGTATINAGSVVTESNSSTKVWNVIINGVAQKILLA
jgi:hypothetical protein